MKKRITISMESGRNNFHNAKSINIIVDSNDTIIGEDGRLMYKLTDSQARRLGKYFCGISDCKCFSGPVVAYDQDRWAIPAKACE